mmetsp:Transcript_89262/g.247877  ORF Transcript_89262/g.247877 Transcript_89262/m.247877 type:complete len:236 (+) Transcript_89262:294-1001(+)
MSGSRPNSSIQASQSLRRAFRTSSLLQIPMLKELAPRCSALAACTMAVCFLAHRGQPSQMDSRSADTCAEGPDISVVPESGMAAQGVTWPVLISSGLQNCKCTISLPATEMPWKPTLQCLTPMEACLMVLRTSGWPRRKTPWSLSSLTHIAKRLVLACSKRPLGGRPNAPASKNVSAFGMPSPRMPSKGPPKSITLLVMSKRPSFTSVSSSPTRTFSRAKTPVTEPLPKYIVLVL